MRRSFGFALAATGVATAAVIWISPQDTGSSPQLVAAKLIKPATAPSGATSPADSLFTQASDQPLLLPSTLAPRDLASLGTRDIFMPVLAPPPPAPPPAAPVAPAPPPPPVPPPMNWRALGAMMAPGGERLVWLSRGTGDVAVKLGMQLDDGYTVQSIEDDAVVLLFPELGITSRIFLPHALSND